MSLARKLRDVVRGRSAGAVFVLTAIVATAVAPQSAAAQGSLTRLVVNDPRGTGALDDERLSLAEAIGLAGGTLRLDELSAAERAQVRGTRPGTRHADVIELTPPGGQVTIDAPLPPLRALAGDTIAGLGTRLRPEPGTPVDATAVLRVASPRVTIRNLVLDGFVNGVEVAPDGVRELQDVTVTGNRFQVTGNAVTVTGVGSEGSAGTVRDVTVSNNGIAANPEGANAIAVRVIGSTGGTAEGAVEDVRISGNTIGEGWGFGVYLAGIQSAGQSSLAGGRLSDVTVSGNRIERTAYDAVALYGGLAFLTEIAGGRTSDIRITGNDLVTGSSAAVNMQAAYTFAGGSARGITLADVSVQGNTITASDRPDGCGGAGVKVQGTLSEANGGLFGVPAGTISDNRTSDVEVVDNTISGCRRGILVAGADHPWPTTGEISGSTVHDVRIKQNYLTGNDVGLVVAGALLFAYPGLPPGDATVRGSRVDDVNVSRNTFTGNHRDIWVLGGGARDAQGSHLVTANTVTDVDFERGTFPGPVTCVLDENYRDGGTADVAANTVRAVECPTR